MSLKSVRNALPIATSADPHIRFLPVAVTDTGTMTFQEQQ